MPQEDRYFLDLSVIIPTLNEEQAIEATLDSVRRLSGPKEVIVVDGGSSDRTVTIARDRGARVLLVERGRGRQLHAGACTGRGQVLWFLHADTHPPNDATDRIRQVLQDPEVVGGCFDIQFSGPSRAAHFLTWLYPFLRWLGLCYGDSGFFVRREVYDQVGGFQPLPIFEDLDLLRRLQRQGRFVRVPSPVVTSPRRFENRSFVFTVAWWTLLQVLYWLGVSPQLLGRWYADIRGKPSR